MPDANGNPLVLEPHKVAIFGRNLDLIAGQEQTHVLAHVDADTNFAEKGDRIIDDLNGRPEFREATRDIEPTPGQKTAKYRRQYFLNPTDCGIWVGTWEKAEQLVDPTNVNVRGMAEARNKQRDKDLVKVLLDPVSELDSEGAASMKALPAEQIIAVDDWTWFRGKADGEATAPTGDTGLTIPKIRAGRILINKSFMTGTPVLLYEEEDLQHLLTSIEANNRDYDHVLRVENGETDIFKKCRFVQVESGTLPVDSNGVADLPLYFPMNIKYKERRYNNLRVVERADMKFRAHAYMEYSRGGLRREDVGVVSIKCKRETA